MTLKSVLADLRVKIPLWGVNIEQAGRHPATIAVGLSTGCWAHRRALIKFDSSLEYEVISHKGVVL